MCVQKGKYYSLLPAKWVRDFGLHFSCDTWQDPRNVPDLFKSCNRVIWRSLLKLDFLKKGNPSYNEPSHSVLLGTLFGIVLSVHLICCLHVMLCAILSQLRKKQ